MKLHFFSWKTVFWWHFNNCTPKNQYWCSVFCLICLSFMWSKRVYAPLSRLSFYLNYVSYLCCIWEFSYSFQITAGWSKLPWKCLSMLTDTIWVIYDYIVSSHFTQISFFSSFGIQGHVTIYTWRDSDINSLA